MRVSTALRLARERRGWTQRELGRKVSYSGNMISAVECEERVMAPDVAARARDLLDDPELYMALAEEAAGSIMTAVVLDGPRVDLHRMSTGQKLIEECSEASRSIAQSRWLINARGPEDLTGERRTEARLICKEAYQVGIAGFNTVRVMCRTYDLSPAEIAAEVLSDLERKGYIERRVHRARAA